MEDKQYKCQICGRMVHEKHALAHAKAEEYLIRLIRNDHPQWHEDETSCPKCIAYYRDLINKTEV